MNPESAFAGAKQRAKDRDIEWHLTFSQWWHLWRDRWSDKPRISLVLARYADWGPYELGNCRVITRAENTAEGRHVTKIVTLIAAQVIDFDELLL